MTPLDLRTVARLLGGEVTGNQVLAPGPGHGPRDRSMAVQINPAAPNGFVVFSHAGDDFKVCRDHVTRQLRLDAEGWRNPPEPRPKPPPAAEDKTAKPLWLWRQRRPIAEDSPAWRYLRLARGYGGLIPATLGFLPARAEHPPALIAAFGIASEPEPGELMIADADVRAVQLIKLKPDGSGRLDKITVGKPLGSPIVVAPPNDLLGLAITEGAEDALSIFAATGLGAWASGGATFLPALAGAVPDYIDCVTIVADRDPAGERGARELAGRLANRGIENLVKFLEAEPTA